jgi:hypothetical protein
MMDRSGFQSHLAPGRLAPGSEALARDSYDFSVVLGGPLQFMLLRWWVITLVPAAPLILTMVPLDELLKRLLQVVL